MSSSEEMVRTALSNGDTADIKMAEQLFRGFKAKLYAILGLR